jgi:carboxyl-terminal processing protease
MTRTSKDVMRALLAIPLAVSVVTFAMAPLSAHAQQTPWIVGNPATGEYTLDAVGLVTDLDGARLTLRSITPGATPVGTAIARIPADAYKQRRVRLRGEVRTRKVDGGGASLWLRVDGPSGMLALDNGSELVVRGDSGWASQSITLLVPGDAARLVFGALLRGTGEMEVRGLRLDTLAASIGTGNATGAAKTVLDSAIALARTHSMWRDTVSWAVVERDVREMARGATTSPEVYQAIRALLARLGDHHSFLMPPRQTSDFRSGGQQNPRAIVRALDDGIGYVSVPAYSGIEPAATRDYARAVHDSLVVAMPNASCGWIVDLRGNGGGNMYPMLAGLKPFLGAAVLGAFVGPHGTRNNWTAGAIQLPPPALAPLESAYVAVLTGPRTGSSGEAVTISFRGRPRTRSFGAPTAGLSTANASYPLSDGSMILLTTAVEADRTGRQYGGKVDPDEVVGGENTAAAQTDSTAAAASRWLRSESRCAR